MPSEYALPSAPPIDIRSSTTLRLAPRTEEPTLDLVIPALNEEHRIGSTIRTICNTAIANGWWIRLIVVDNGCVDATTDAADAARLPQIPVEVIGCRTRGKGAAVRAGIAHSRAPYVGYCDADLSTPPEAIGEGAGLLSLGWDVVIGSRRCVGATYAVSQPRMRRVGSLAFRAAASRVVPSISDTQCGFKLFRTPVAKALFAPARIDGFAFDVEILARAIQNGCRMIELPIQWSDCRGSTLRHADGVEAFRDLWAVRRMLRRPTDAVVG